MGRDLLIGIDAGTSVIKSVAFTLDGVQVGSFAKPNVYRTVSEAGAEQDMAQTWADGAATLRGLVEAPGPPSQGCFAQPKIDGAAPVTGLKGHFAPAGTALPR